MKTNKCKFRMFLLSLILILWLLPMGTHAATAALDAKSSGAVVTKGSFGLTAPGTSTLTVTYNGKKISNSKAEFKSSKPRVATVSKNGVISTKTFGKTTISVKYKGKTKKLSLTVSLPDTKIKADGKTLGSRKLEVKPGNKTQLSLSLGYRNSGARKTTYKTISSKKIMWKSNKKSVATVSSTGQVTAKKTGTAVITMYYGCVIEEVTVRVVKNPAPQESLDPEEEGQDTPDPAKCIHEWEEQYKPVAVPPEIVEIEGWANCYTETPYYTVAAQNIILVHVYYKCSCGKVFDSSTSSDFTDRAMENYRDCKVHVDEMLTKGEYHTYKPVATERERKHLYTLCSCACGLKFINYEGYDEHVDEIFLNPDGRSHSYSSSEVYETDPNIYVAVYESYIKSPASVKYIVSGYHCINCGATKSN